jgi:hypothetical protein
MGSMLARGQKLRRQGLATSHLFEGASVHGPVEPALLSSPLVVSERAPRNPGEVAPLFTTAARNFLDRLFIVWAASDIQADRSNRRETSSNLAKARGDSSLTRPQPERCGLFPKTSVAAHGITNQTRKRSNQDE